MNTRRALWILGIIVLLCLAALAAAKLMPSGKTVLISQDGEVLYTIDLSKVQEPYTITIPWEDGYNMITITPETVYVSQADCDNQVCVHHGALEPGGTPITCLPHRLIISWEDAP